MNLSKNYLTIFTASQHAGKCRKVKVSPLTYLNDIFVAHMSQMINLAPKDKTDISYSSQKPTPPNSDQKY